MYVQAAATDFKCLSFGFLLDIVFKANCSKPAQSPCRHRAASVVRRAHEAPQQILRLNDWALYPKGLTYEIVDLIECLMVTCREETLERSRQYFRQKGGSTMSYHVGSSFVN